MKILSIDHITINVVDLAASEHFYREILGLEKTDFIHMGDHTLTYYQLSGRCRLELIRYLTKTGTARTAETDCGIYRHFCIETDDLKSVYETCAAHDVTVRKAPSHVEKLGCDTMLIVDPNGVEIEIIDRK